MIGMRAAVFRVATAMGQGHHAVADLPALDFSATSDNLACYLETRQGTRVRRDWVMTCALQTIRAIDTRCRNCH